MVVHCAGPHHLRDYHFYLKDKVLQEEEQDRGKDKKGGKSMIANS